MSADKDYGDPGRRPWSQVPREAVPGPRSQWPEASPWQCPPEPVVAAVPPAEPATAAGGYRAGADTASVDLLPPRTSAWMGRVLLPVAALVLLAVVVAAGLALGPAAGQRRRAAAGAATVPATGPAAAASQTPAPGGHGAGPQVSATSTTVSQARPGQSASAQHGAGSVIYEAEAAPNSLSGSAFVASYPGASAGRIVKNIGAWGNPGGSGRLRFDDVSVPVSGVYLLTVYYVHVSGDSTRTMVITVSGFDPVTVTVTASATCCSRRVVPVHLAAGTNMITFSNRNGHAPAIDAIGIAPDST